MVEIISITFNKKNLPDLVKINAPIVNLVFFHYYSKLYLSTILLFLFH